MLQQHQLHVLLGQLALGERTHEEDVRVGAARHRDALALEVGDGLDRAVALGHQRRPFGARIDVDRLDRVAVDLADQRGGAGRRSEIERTRVEEFERLVGAGRQHPADGDAILLELLLEQALVLQHEADGIVGRPVDANFLHLRLGAGHGRCRERQAQGGKEAKRIAAIDREHRYSSPVPTVAGCGRGLDG